MLSPVSFSFFALSLAAILVKATQFDVTVGGDSLAFTPPFVTANVGDVVLFTFKQKNHTVTQSTFTKPCEMLPGGFDSGFMPVDVGNTDGPFPVARVAVQGSDAVWVYCRQAGHCKKGMVFAINPGVKFGPFQAAAKASVPTTTSTTTTSTSSISNGTSTATATLSPASATSTTTTNGGTQLTSGASAVVMLGSVILGMLI